MVAREMPLAAASLRKAASHGSKLPVLRQLLLGGGYLLGSPCAVPDPPTMVQMTRSSATAASILVNCRIEPPAEFVGDN